MVLTALVLSLTGLVRPAPKVPTPTPVRVILTGICAFQDLDANHPFVLFPKADVEMKTPTGHTIPAHRAYIRYTADDVASITHKDCHSTPDYKPEFDSVCYLDHERLELTGVVTGTVNHKGKFDDLIVPMTDIVDDDSIDAKFLAWTAATPLAARFEIPGGNLTAEDVRDCDWLFEPTKPGKGNRKLGQKVTLEVQRTSKSPVTVKSNNSTAITFKADRSPKIEIGQVMDTEIESVPIPVSYSIGEPDDHFYLHYMLLANTCQISGAPHQCPIPKIVGACKKIESTADCGAKQSAMTPMAAGTSMPLPAFVNYLLYGHNCPPRR